MNENFWLIIFGNLFILLIWKRVFDLRGKVFLVLNLILFNLGVSLSVKIGYVLLTLLGASILLITTIKRFKSKPYTPAEASFETSEILRGLTSVEAAHFLNLLPEEIFCVAILELIDKEVIYLAAKPTPIISISPDFRIDKIVISPEERKNKRYAVAKQKKVILHPYDDLILEMVSAQSNLLISEFDVGIWHRIFLSFMENLEQVYQADLTRQYALNITDKFTAIDSAFSENKKSLSGWHAIKLFSLREPKGKTHRPSWLAPEDEFNSLVLSIVGDLKS